MTIDERSIANMARQIRNEQNQQMTVSPWTPAPSSRSGAIRWLVALPAAALVGFVLGQTWRQPTPMPEPQVIVKTDTVYLERPIVVTPSVAQQPPANAPTQQQQPRKSPKPKTQPNTRPNDYPTGLPMTDDHIRYDLIAKQQ